MSAVEPVIPAGRDPMNPAERAAMAERLLAIYATALHHFDLTHLVHEAERAETLPTSPMSDRIRQLVTDELVTRMGVPA